MSIQRTALLLCMLIASAVHAQDFSFAQNLYANHGNYRVNGFESRRIRHNEVLIRRHKSNSVLSMLERIERSRGLAVQKALADLKA